MDGNSLGTQAELMDSLEEKARAEYEGFIQLFVDPKGDVSRRQNMLERGAVRAACILPKRLRERVDDSIERRVVERCVEDYLGRMEKEVDVMGEKAASASKTYDRSLELVTMLRIDYIDKLALADQCEEERQKGEVILGQTREELDRLLAKRKTAEARETQKVYIRTEKTARVMERERDKHSSNSLGVFNQLSLMFTVYERAKVYSQFLGRNAAILDQTYDNLRMRWEEYQHSGNVGDVLEFLKWNEEIRNAKEVFDRNFTESLPLIREVDGKVVKDVSKGPVQNNTSSEVYSQAKSLRDKVMELNLG